MERSNGVRVRDIALHLHQLELGRGKLGFELVGKGDEAPLTGVGEH